MNKEFDAVITGSGINGISAAIRLQKIGLKTLIVEQSSSPGGSTKTEELTLKNFLHDVGSAIHPMAYASPYLRTLNLESYGLEWIFPEIAFAHPFPDGSALSCYQDLDKTAAQFGEDKQSFKHLFGQLVESWENIENDLLAPLGIPKDPVNFLKFGFKALPSAKLLSNHYFKNAKSKAFFYGAAAHSCLSMESIASSSFGLVLGIMALKFNWPFPKGGAYQIVNALLSCYGEAGGDIRLNYEVNSMKDLPKASTYLFDLTPKQLLKLEGTNFTAMYRRRMENYNYGPGVFKIDWALKGPIPFLNEDCKKAGTLHIGFSAEEISESEKLVNNGEISNKPYILLAQQSRFDPSRAPDGKHTAWAYCHVPFGNTDDQTMLIEDQIEKIAPGFKDLILKKSKMSAKQLQSFNPNIIGGDINGGTQDITQLFTRPIAKSSPYATSNKYIYICSSSTPPGGGVHGMCGYHAANKVLKDHFKNIKTPRKS
ncbi:phytoene desaturase family protein [Christiangramia echinicola]|uniref:Pyridine nucleotide-disulfide oxidoreductase domain-containing protein 2 n=1 Tax=Christiangramia echinicola TaxID=279359 RepID=A0A1H1RGE3_9FLAO|nr:NAD(P)/FAD-dependent oxidoreductase [Christiangramia echinicola]SDS34814.1 Phytoene dehydrogenase-related protein [Christiangramia echinicola]